MPKAKRLFICLDNKGCEVSLERLKIYIALPDAKAGRAGYLRIVDESGEDYLHPRLHFVAAELPVSTRRAVLKAAHLRESGTAAAIRCSTDGPIAKSTAKSGEARGFQGTASAKISATY